MSSENSSAKSKDDRISNNTFHSPRLQEYKLTLRILLENRSSAAGLIIVLAYAAIAVIDFVHPQLIGVQNAYSMVPNYSNTIPQPPAWPSHPFGTTFPGIDLYQAVMAAIRVDLWYSFLIVLSGAAIGTIIGVVAAYFGGYLEEGLMRFTDIFLSVPYLPFAIAVGFFLGRQLNDLSLALIIVWWPLYARYARGQALSIKEYAYIEAATASGVGSWRIMLRHIVPNVLTPTFVQISLDLGTVVQVFAALTFIGFATSNPLLPELGTLISDGFQYAVSAPWVVFFPGIAILIFAIGMNLLGDGLRDSLIEERELSSKLSNPAGDILLRISGLSISFITRSGKVQAVKNVSFEVKRGESFGLVGETGCGKSQTALAIMRLTPDSGMIEHGEIWFEGNNLTENIAKEFTLITKTKKRDNYSLKRNKRELNRMNSEMTRIRGKEISMIFQEPMTSLNPVYTIGRQISEVLIAHCTQSIANRILARARIDKEELRIIAEFISNNHDASRSELQEFLQGLGLAELGDLVWFIFERKDIGIAQKTETIMSLSYRRLSPQTLSYLKNLARNGNVPSFGYRVLDRTPLLNRWFIGVIRKETLIMSYELLSLVSMPNAENVLRQYPHELSGGMRQRVMVAMAIAAKPKLIIADEPTSALDVTVQAQILELLQDMKDTFGTSLLFISHDMGVVSEICDKVGVMYAGNIVESATVNELFEDPKHPYTQGLLDAIPKLGDTRETLQTIKGDLPNLMNPPPGCRFNTRCPRVFDRCSSRPPLIRIGNEHEVLCWLYVDSEKSS